MEILDLCSGMGGTSRHVAYRYGATVLGIDANESRVAGARTLADMVRVVSQEAFLHVSDRAGLLAGSARVLKEGGGLGFTDWTATDRPDAAARRRLAEGMAALGMASAGGTVALLRAAGFATIEVEDLSAEWRIILRGRLEKFRAMEAGTVARSGRERHATHIGNYELFVDRIVAGALGGGRFIAWKA